MEQIVENAWSVHRLTRAVTVNSRVVFIKAVQHYTLVWFWMTFGFLGFFKSVFFGDDPDQDELFKITSDNGASYKNR